MQSSLWQQIYDPFGKMIDAQSIVGPSTATRWFNHEGDILRFVFWHPIALACLVGGLVTLQA